MSVLLDMFRQAIDFAMSISYIKIFDVSPFQVALIGFLAFTFFRFIVDPLLSTGGGSWGLFSSVSDTVKVSQANQKKSTISNRIGFR